MSMAHHTDILRMSLDPSHRGILLRSPIARAIHFGRFAFFSARFFRRVEYGATSGRTGLKPVVSHQA
jgi:hypothetical protein